jgi:UDPglucose 6-dehydrogenase
MRLAVIGAGYVGSVAAACFARVGHRVVGLEADASRAGQLASGQPTIYEPGLGELLSETLPTGRLTFTNDPAEAIPGAEAAFICVGTPQGADALPDLSQMERAVADVAPHMDPGLVVVNKSTMPVGSANLVRTLLEEAIPNGARHRFAVVSNPEFLREGRAVEDFLHPDRVVVGGEPEGIGTVVEAYRPILDQDFSGGRGDRRPELFVTSMVSAEMVKYASNAFLATKVSFANEIAALCELVGADARAVLPALGADRRIGGDFLAPGLGWGGSCLPKDVAALVAMGSAYGHPASLLRAAADVNRQQIDRTVAKLQAELKVLAGRRVAILGITFKPGTDDLRESPSLALTERLTEAGALVTAHDPVVKEAPPSVRLAPDPYGAADRADAVVVATGWSSFVELNFHVLAQRMRGRLVVDARNVLPPDRVAAAGLRLVGVGW